MEAALPTRPMQLADQSDPHSWEKPYSKQEGLREQGLSSACDTLAASKGLSLWVPGHDSLPL